MVFGTSVVYDLIARDKASRTLRKVGDSAARSERGFGRLGRAAKLAALDIGAASVAVGVVSVKMATDFQSSMTKIQSMAGGSAKDVRTLSGEVLKLGKYAEQSPKELADSLYHLKSVGMDNVSAMKALRQSSDLAAVGGNSLEETTNALAGAWRSGIKGGRDFHGAVATLNAIVGAGNMKMEDLTAAMGTGFLPTAKSFGVGLKEVGAALALMTDEGIPADAAATRLRMSMSLLAAPSAAAEKVLGGIGLTGHKLGETLRKKNGLIKTIQLLKDHLRGLNNFYPNPQKADAFVAKWKETVDKLLKKKPGTPLTTAQSTLLDQYKLAQKGLVTGGGALDPAEQAAVLSKAFGGGRSSSAILTMINNLDVLKQKQDQINGSVGRFGQSVKTQRQTAEAQFKLLKSSLDVLAIKLGTALLPWAVSFVRYLNSTVMPQLDKFVNWFGKTGAPKIKKFADQAKPFIKDVLTKTRDILKDAEPYAKGFVEAFDKLPKSVKTGLGSAALLGFGAKKLGLFSLLGSTKGRGGLGGGSGLLGLVSRAKPVPVIVMNRNFGGAGGLGAGAGAGEGALAAGGLSVLTIGSMIVGTMTAGYLIERHTPVGKWATHNVPEVDPVGSPWNGRVAAQPPGITGWAVKMLRGWFDPQSSPTAKAAKSLDALTEKTHIFKRALDDLPGHIDLHVRTPELSRDILLVQQYKGMLDGLDGRVVNTFIKSRLDHNAGQLNRFGHNEAGTTARPSIHVQEQHFHGIDYHQWRRNQEHDLRAAALGGVNFVG